MSQKLFLQILAIAALASSVAGHLNDRPQLATNGFMIGLVATVMAGMESDRSNRKAKKAKPEPAPVDPLTAVTLNKQADQILDEMAAMPAGTLSENDSLSNGERASGIPAFPGQR